MEANYKNDELLNLIKGSYYILDAVVTRFNIYQQDDLLCIDVYLTSQNRKPKIEQHLELHFVDVIEYGFYHNNKHTFYNVERYKFFKSEKGFYLSLDPYDEIAEPNEEDQDFIVSKEVEGYLF